MMSFGKGAVSRVLQALLYFPVSFSVIGLVAYHVRFPGPVIDRYPFRDVFLFYANPLNPGDARIHLWTLIFCSAFLVLLITRDSRTEAIVTLTQLRILLLIPLTIVTLLVDILFNTLIGASALGPQARRDLLLPLFLHVDVHLFLLYLWTYLPLARHKSRT